MLRLAGMIRIVHLAFLCVCCGSLFGATKWSPSAWDLETYFNASPYVFVGKLESIEVLPEVKTGVMGIEATQLTETNPAQEEIIWRNVRLYTFRVIQSFKGELAGQIEVYAPEAGSQWSYFRTEIGDVFVSKAADPDPYAVKLSVGEQGLFFVNAFNGSTLPVLIALRSEAQAERGIRILGTYKQTAGVELSAVIELDDTVQAATAEQQSSQLAALEKRYFKILMISNLQERRSALERFIAEMGYDGLWSRESFQANYQDSFGMVVEEGRVRSAPTRPDSGRERLWYECTMEIEKIDMILKARAKN